MADILIIDDDPSMRRLMIRILTAAGHRVRDAADGKVGLDLFRQARPDLVITDILMPEREGIETICQLRTEAAKPLILAISGGGSLYLRFATELGASAQLAKPFATAQLLQAVADLLGGAEPN